MKKLSLLLLLLLSSLALFSLAACGDGEAPPIFDQGSSDRVSASSDSSSAELAVLGEVSGKVFLLEEDYFLMRDRLDPTLVYRVEYVLSQNRFGKEPNLVVGYSAKSEAEPYPEDYPDAEYYTSLVTVKGEVVEKNLYVDDLPNDLDIPGSL